MSRQGLMTYFRESPSKVRQEVTRQGKEGVQGRVDRGEGRYAREGQTQEEGV